jgi:RNA polymerase sigma-70 factor (ECF subfamily)
VDVQAEECAWVRRARAGNRAAFAALVDRYWEPLRRWLFGLTGRAHQAEDLTQEAFFRAWSGMGQLHDDGAFRVWLFRIARHCLLDQRRGTRGVSVEDLPEGLTSGAAEPLEQLLEQESDRLLQGALMKLPTKYRAAYLLWTHDELPYHQIAQVLGTTEETARWRVCVARQFLVKALQSYLDVNL